jgi:hypothetical protein
VNDISPRRATRYLSHYDRHRVINKDTTLVDEHASRLYHHYAYLTSKPRVLMPWLSRRMPLEGGWTVATLLEYINARISDMELRNQQRFEAQIDASAARNADMELRQQQRFEAQTKAIEAAITAQRTAIDAALIAANQATAKAEAATEIRFVGINGSLHALTDQMASLITRQEAEAMYNRNTERIAEISERMSDYASKTLVVGEYDRVMSRVEAISTQQTLLKGRGVGINALWVYVLGAIAAIGTLVSLYVAMK